MSISKKELGLLVKKARRIKADKIGSNYSQTSLSKDIGKSRGYIGDIENGRCYPSYTTLCSIAEACEVSVDFFQSDVEKTIEYQLSNYPVDTVNEVKECLMKDDDTEMNFLSSDEDDSIKLVGYFSKEDFQKDKVGSDMPTHRRIRLLMEHKSLDLHKLAKISKVDFDDLNYICGGYFLDKSPTKKISKETYKKIANTLDTSVDFLLCKTNYKWNRNSMNEFSKKEDLVEFLLNNKLLENKIKCDISQLSDEEKKNLIDDTLNMIELISYKYKK